MLPAEVSSGDLACLEQIAVQSQRHLPLDRPVEEPAASITPFAHFRCLQTLLIARYMRLSPPAVQ